MTTSIDRYISLHLPIRSHKEDSLPLPAEITGPITLKVVPIEPGRKDDGSILEEQVRFSELPGKNVMDACTPGPQSHGIRTVNTERLTRDEQTEQERAAPGSITPQGRAHSSPVTTSALCLRHGLPQVYTDSRWLILYSQ